MKKWNIGFFAFWLILFIVLAFVPRSWASFEKRIEIELFAGVWMVYSRIQVFRDEMVDDEDE